MERYRERADSGERHPGHGAQSDLHDLRERLRQHVHTSLDIGGFVREIDTTRFDAIPYDDMVREILGLRAQASGRREAPVGWYHTSERLNRCEGSELA